MIDNLMIVVDFSEKLFIDILALNFNLYVRSLKDKYVKLLKAVLKGNLIDSKENYSLYKSFQLESCHTYAC